MREEKNYQTVIARNEATTAYANNRTARKNDLSAARRTFVNCVTVTVWCSGRFVLAMTL